MGFYEELDNGEEDNGIKRFIYGKYICGQSFSASAAEYRHQQRSNKTEGLNYWRMQGIQNLGPSYTQESLL